VGKYSTSQIGGLPLSVLEQSISPEPALQSPEGDARDLRLAIDHARRGNAVAARILLVDLCVRNPASELAWLWRASLATSAEEGLLYLDNVLRLNPQNRTALGWLAKMGRPVPPAAPAPAAPEAEKPNQPTADSPAPAEQSAPAPVEQSAPAPVEQSAPAPIQRSPAPAAAETPAEPAPAPQVPPPAAPTLPRPLATKPAAPPPPAAPSRRLDGCPVCFQELAPDAHRCDACKAIVVMNEPIDFALNKGLDRELASAALDFWRSAAGGEANALLASLAQVMIHMNRLEYAQARACLARAAAHPQPAAAVRELREGRLALALQQPVVMVVDDSATIRDVLVRTLAPAGMLPLPVAEAWDVLPALLAQQPDVLLLDVTMPGLGGMDLCRQIRSTKELRGLPVLMLTGHDHLMDKLKGKMAGATEYLTKPFKPEALQRSVRKYLGKRR